MRRTISFAAVLILATGCQTDRSARYVMRQADSGVVAIPRDTPGERGKAMEMIVHHVGKSFVIDKEEEIQLSTPNGRDRSMRNSMDPLAQKSMQDTFALATRPASEFRIHYRRTPANVMNMPGAAPAQAATPTGNIQQAGAIVIPVETPTPTPTAASASVHSFLPVTCEGCQGR